MPPAVVVKETMCIGFPKSIYQNKLVNEYHKSIDSLFSVKLYLSYKFHGEYFRKTKSTKFIDLFCLKNKFNSKMYCQRARDFKVLI